MKVKELRDRLSVYGDDEEVLHQDNGYWKPLDSIMVTENYDLFKRKFYFGI